MGLLPKASDAILQYMGTRSLSQKLNQDGMQVVLSANGRPAFVQIPWHVLIALSEAEQETLEILSDPWWSEQLQGRLGTFKKDTSSVLRDSSTLDDYRAQRD